MADTDQAPTGERQFLVRTIYTKDLSFESPNAPEIFRDEWKPDSTLQFDIKLQQLAEHTHEVVLTLTTTAKLGEKTAFLIEVQQAGIVTIGGFTEAELGQLFYVYCPSILYPYARQTVMDLVAKGGFPPLVLQHVAFDQIYAQKLNDTPPANGDGTQRH
ncbi:protein-export chaperone SecB [Thiospirillum jenense]|uniref:Protein-export protein SecB n=1 Tax=Thiospirillum jenense TaxID=1653858 RepID=A0A839H617_9GAMM|nr:protein-export chaperone SecB [Thiospirillum jenense]MBB1125315.1 protein-export chaperone SecB [Thiospirillum jenense]